VVTFVRDECKSNQESNHKWRACVRACVRARAGGRVMRIGMMIVSGGLLAVFASCHAEEPRTSANTGGNHAEEVEGATSKESNNESAEAAERKKDDRKIELGRAVSEDERWTLTDAKAKKQLVGTEFGEREIRWYWKRKGWHMTKMEEKYGAEVEALLAAGDIIEMAPWYVCPYGPVFQAIRATTVMGKPVQRMQEFYFDGCENDDELLLGNPRFKRADYQADHDESFSDGKHQGGVPQGPTGERKR
jgi:hypothetical protein